MKNINLSQLLISAFFCIFTVLIVGTSSIYFGNEKEFEYLYIDLFLYLLLILALILFFIFIIGKVSNSKINKFLALSFTSLGVLFWIQGVILVRNIGQIDGTQINWSIYKSYIVFDLALWLIVITLFFLKRELVFKYVVNICLFFVIFQSIFLVFSAINLRIWEKPKKITYSEAEKYLYSDSENVVVMVLDTFSSLVFQDLIIHNPEFKKQLDGFTYYKNAVGGFPTTYASIPYILTGSLYDNSVPIQEFIKKQYTEKSLPKSLKEAGFQVEIYENVSPKSAVGLEQFSSNITNQHATPNKNDILKIVKLAFFRYSPQILKPYFFQGYDPKVADLPDGIKQINVGNKNKLFKFYHFVGPHPPFLFYLDYYKIKLDNSKESYEKESKEWLNLVVKYIETLKKNGVYDNTLLYIIADHGLYPTNVDSIPLILHKPFNSHGQLKTSYKPVSLGDIPNSVMNDLQLQESFEGKALARIEEKENRSRYFYRYSWKDGDWDHDFFPPMVEYKIIGDSWNIPSWTCTYRKLEAGNQSIIMPVIYGENLLLNEDLFLQNITIDPKGLNWTRDYDAIIHIPVASNGLSLFLEMDLIPYISENIPEQELNIYVNGKFLQKFNLKNHDKIKTYIPSDLIVNNSLQIWLNMPKASIPGGKETRNLAIAVQSMSINIAAP